MPASFYLMHWGLSWLPPAYRDAWSWKAGLALFFAGSSAMVLFLSAWEDWRGEHPRLAHTGMLAGLVGLVVMGILFIWDLGNPLRFWELMVYGWTQRLGSSWMPWGVLFMVLLGLAALVEGWGIREDSWRKPAAAATMLFGLLVTTYSGFELADTSIALWNTYLPLVFLTVSLSIAGAFVPVLAGQIGDEGARQRLVARYRTLTLVSLASTALVLLFWLYTAGHLDGGRALPTVDALLGGSLAGWFWAAVLLGLAAAALLWRASDRLTVQPAMRGAIFALTGSSGLILRLLIVLAGYHFFAPLSPFGVTHIELP
ncbi:membrane protein of unknown function [Candidatus Hydrogenisulfobacillus filiaventi]|uniref:Polysulfide reductase n=1 Tax=Candidatus Hydrogenisulfobacillus filiaventi TaxID=2707344 RepID=A0A6F8ZH92_9FIRM|nr:hypothetical protein [Bacillota bacterium]CAB1129310.1 membrane protein of unknown function [Candidatus Hydrogenisulfobacillus filiaventi]